MIGFQRFMLKSDSDCRYGNAFWHGGHLIICPYPAFPTGEPQKICILCLQIAHQCKLLTCNPQPPHIPGSLILAVGLFFRNTCGDRDASTAFWTNSSTISLNTLEILLKGYSLSFLQAFPILFDLLCVIKSWLGVQRFANQSSLRLWLL